MPHISGDPEAGHRNVRPGGGTANERPSINVRPSDGNIRPGSANERPPEQVSPRIAAGQPTRPLSAEEIQAGARANFFPTIGNVLESITAPGAGLITEFANKRPNRFVEQALLPSPLIAFLDFIQGGTPDTFAPAVEQARSEGLGVVESRARAFEDTRDEFPFAQRLALEVAGDPLNIPGAAVVRQSPRVARGAAAGIEGLRNIGVRGVEQARRLRPVRPIPAPAQAVTRDISEVFPQGAVNNTRPTATGIERVAKEAAETSTRTEHLSILNEFKRGPIKRNLTREARAAENARLENAIPKEVNDILDRIVEARFGGTGRDRLSAKRGVVDDLTGALKGPSINNISPEELRVVLGEGLTRPRPPQVVRPIEGTNQAVEFTPPIRARNIRPAALPDKPPIVKSPNTAREFAAAKVDRRLAIQERTKKSPLVQKAIKAIKDTKIVRRATTELISEQRPGRVARGIAASEGGPIRTRGRRFFGAQRGEFETFEPDDAISRLFTDDEFDELVGMIRDPDIFDPVSQAFQMNTADRAFQKLFDENLLPTEGEIALLEEVFGGGFVRATLRKRRLGRKIFSGILDAWNLPRAFIASGDLSGTLRQAGMLAAGNPRRFGQANAAQFRAVASKRNFLIEKELIESNPNFQRFTRKPSPRPGVQSETRLQLTSISGTSPLNAREEVFLSGFSDNIPVIKQSQRAFVALLNKLRMDVMDDMVGLIEIGGKKATEAELDSIANYINRSTGRGPLPVSQDIAALLNGVFFSSRLFTSRIALPFSVLSKSSTIRKKAAKDLVKAVSFVISMEMLVKYSGAGEVETDSRSSDFGKMKLGKVRIDPWFGYQQIARLVGQLATGERKSVGTGSISELDRTETVIRFIRSKLHPSAGAVWSLVDGENFLGDPFLPALRQPFSEEGIQQPSDLLDIRKNPVFEGLAFLFVQDMLDAIAEDGLLSGFKAGAAGFSGLGAVTFTSQDDVAQEVHGAGFDEIYPFQQTEVRAIFNAQEDETPERLKDGTTINPALSRSRQLDIIRMDKLQELAELTGASLRVAVPFLGLSPRQRAQGTNIIRDYFDIKAENAIRKNESRENLFGDTDYQQDSRGTLKEKAALQEYYNAIDESKSPAGRFLSDVWQKKREELTRKWKAEGTLLYVQANTNTKPVPKRLEDFLRRRSKNEWQRIQDSKDAREVLNNRVRDTGPNPDNTSVDKPIRPSNNVRPSGNRNVRP